MQVFSESFYTTDFDQEMMDFINKSYKCENIEFEWSNAHMNLYYGSGTGSFWTDDDSPEDYTGAGYTKLTKQQFKEKIGMPLDNTVLKKETFSKKDLVDGMFVKCRNGEVHIVLGGIVCDDSGFLDLEEYDEEMLHLGASDDFKELDIMEVLIKNTNHRLHEYLSGGGLKSIWKRKPPKSEKAINLEKAITFYEEQLTETKKLLEKELQL